MPYSRVNPSYIQKGTDIRRDLLTYYGIYIKSIPFQPFPELKDLPKRDWADQQGDDEFIPVNPVFKAYETTVDFVYVGGLETSRDAIYSMISYMQGAEFSLWDSWKKKGIRCRYVGYTDSAFYRKDEDIVSFSLKLKVNNPLCYGIFTSEPSFSSKADSDMTVFWADGTINYYIKNSFIVKSILGFEFGIVLPSVLSNIKPAIFSFSHAWSDFVCEKTFTNEISFSGAWSDFVCEKIFTNEISFSHAWSDFVCELEESIPPVDYEMAITGSVGIPAGGQSGETNYFKAVLSLVSSPDTGISSTSDIVVQGYIYELENLSNSHNFYITIEAGTQQDESAFILETSPTSMAEVVIESISISTTVGSDGHTYNITF